MQILVLSVVGLLSFSSAGSTPSLQSFKAREVLTNALSMYEEDLTLRHQLKSQSDNENT